LTLAAQVLKQETLPQETSRVVRNAAQLVLHGLFALAHGCRDFRFALARGGPARFLAPNQILLAWLGTSLWGLVGCLARRLSPSLSGPCPGRHVLLGFLACLGLGLVGPGPTRLRPFLGLVALLPIALPGFAFLWLARLFAGRLPRWRAGRVRVRVLGT
jgi:hypothetical protein